VKQEKNKENSILNTVKEELEEYKGKPDKTEAAIILNELKEELEENPVLVNAFQSYRDTCLDKLIEHKPSTFTEISNIIDEYNDLWNLACKHKSIRLLDLFKVTIVTLICDSGILPERLALKLMVWSIE
jgi:hypothetical protein